MIATNSAAQATARILVVDDDKAFRVATKTLLEDEGYRVTVADGGEAALGLLEQQEFDLLLSDLVMQKMSGVHLLAEAKKKRPAMPVIMVTGFGSIPTAIEAMKLGAIDYLTKPTNNDELLLKIRRALELSQRDRELNRLREELRTSYTYANIVTRSAKMRDVIRQIEQVADTDVTVLIQGESGTGKELVARALHFNSIRKDHPFVVVNCSALPENLLESELFGHTKGAFTGATRDRIGKFAEADRGTLFLDEIGDISPAVQTKLLRFLQEKSFEQVGGNTELTVDTRVVAATNRNLQAMVREGDFREDLFYRLNVFPITLPPLRERLEDIPLLAEHFLRRHNELSGGRVISVSPEVLHTMMNYHWPGNVRELENLLKRAIIKSAGTTITSIDLPSTESSGVASGAAGSDAIVLDMPFKDYVAAILRDAEERYLLKMLRLHQGNIRRIAQLMGVDRKTIYRKLAEYSIDPDRFRT